METVGYGAKMGKNGWPDSGRHDAKCPVQRSPNVKFGLIAQFALLSAVDFGGWIDFSGALLAVVSGAAASANPSLRHSYEGRGQALLSIGRCRELLGTDSQGEILKISSFAKPI